jgi:glycosyltransferase involved in cell wall biosynthesis
MSDLKFSLCIATMDRWSFLQINLPKYLDNPFIAEIIISDENGNDAKIIQEHYNDSKLKVFTNASRLGAFKNKRMAVSKASYPWVCLVDSDNFIPVSYFEAAVKVLDPSNPNIIYAPSYTFPQSNHPGFNWRDMIGVIFTPANYKIIWKTYKNSNVVINTGNYIVSKELFMRSEHPNDGTDYDITCTCLDVLYQNYLIFNNGGSLMVVADMEYHHIVHPGSYYMKENNINHQKFFESLMI